MRRMTIWYRQHSDGGSSFNHIENGHNKIREPKPIDAAQAKMWRSEHWYKELGYLDSNSILRRI